MVKEYILRYERHISAASIIAAFIIDSVTLIRLDEFLTQFLLVVYLTVVGVGIILLNLREIGKADWISDNAHLWLTIAIQFSFGGLFGRFLIYYSRSGAISSSWPLLLIFASLLVGNEFAKKYYSRLILQSSFFFLAVFAFMIFFIPLLTGQMGPIIFFASGVVSLVIFAGFLGILRRFSPHKVRESIRSILGVAALIYGILNALYFSNIIPPIPLALRDAGVYHSVAKSGVFYNVVGEGSSLFGFLQLFPIIHLTPGSAAYVYTAVFAPTNFGTSISHNWQYYDETNRKWVDSDTVTFPIVGGSDRGYRGYTIKSGIKEGKWRVNVETARRQVIGRVNFRVEYSDQTPGLEYDQK